MPYLVVYKDIVYHENAVTYYPLRQEELGLVKWLGTIHQADLTMDGVLVKFEGESLKGLGKALRRLRNVEVEFHRER